MTTDKQKATVHFCEQWLNVTFEGDINNFRQVNNFLSEYLEDAKLLYNEIPCVISLIARNSLNYIKHLDLLYVLP